jgi:hypothetical protein
MSVTGGRPSATPGAVKVVVDESFLREALRELR